VATRERDFAPTIPDFWPFYVSDQTGFLYAG